MEKRISVLCEVKPYQIDMVAGFMAYQIMGEGEWRHSAFETNKLDQNQISMISFKGNGYGYLYKDGIANRKHYVVLDSLEKAKMVADIHNKCMDGQKEDRRYIESNGQYM